MVRVFLGQRGRLPLIPLLVDTLNLAQQAGLFASQFALGKSVLPSALRLLEQRRESSLDSVLLDPRRKLHEVNRLDE